MDKNEAVESVKGRLRREVDDRIEPVLIEMGNDKSGFLEHILSSGEILYERAAGSSVK